MENHELLTIKKTDFERLSALANSIATDTAELLEEELGRAAVVSDDQLPEGVVFMNSKVSFIDLDTGKESEVTLVYPHEAESGAHKISVLAPVGAALIGLRTGQSIDWPLPNGGLRRLKVLAVKTTEEF